MNRNDEPPTRNQRQSDHWQTWIRHEIWPLQLGVDVVHGYPPPTAELRALLDYDQHPDPVDRVATTASDILEIVAKTGSTPAARELYLQAVLLFRAQREKCRGIFARVTRDGGEPSVYWVWSKKFISWCESRGIGTPAELTGRPEMNTLPQMGAEPRAENAVLDQQPEYLVSRTRSGGWLLRFRGEEVRMDHDYKGLLYIAEILRRTPEPVDGASLLQAEGAATPDSRQDRVDAELSRTTTQTQYEGLQLEGRTQAEIESAAEKLREDEKVARESGNIERATELREKRKPLEKYLRGSTRPDHRSKPLTDGDRSKMRKSIGKNIATAIRAITKRNKRIGRHLSNAIKRKHSGSPCYLPDEPIDWNFRI